MKINNTHREMSQPTLLAGFLVGMALIVGFAVLPARQRRSAPAGRDTTGIASALGRQARTPAAWSVGFVLLTVVAGVATVLVVGGFGTGSGLGSASAALLAVIGAVVLGGYVFVGTFLTARSRGLYAAQAAAFGSWAVGLLVLAAVAVALIGAG